MVETIAVLSFHRNLQLGGVENLNYVSVICLNYVCVWVFVRGGVSVYSKHTHTHTPIWGIHMLERKKYCKICTLLHENLNYVSVICLNYTFVWGCLFVWHIHTHTHTHTQTNKQRNTHTYLKHIYVRTFKSIEKSVRCSMYVLSVSVYFQWTQTYSSITTSVWVYFQWTHTYP